MIYFVVVVLAITAVVQAILLYENKNTEDFYIEERRHARKYRAELEARLAHAEKEARLAQAEEKVKLLQHLTQEVDKQINEAVRLANQERNINE